MWLTTHFKKKCQLVPSKLLSMVGLLLVSALTLSGCSMLEKNSNAGLQIITSDIPSTIFLNSQYLEKTPLIEKNIKPGEYTIRIQPDDTSYVPHELHVTLRKGLLTVVTWKPGKRPETSGGVVYEMEPLKNKQDTEVSFVTIPDGAIIQIQGRDKEFSPSIIKDVAGGHTEFEVVLPSYETQKHTLNVVPGYRMLVNIKLAKLDTMTPDPTPSLPPTATGSALPEPATTSASPTIPQPLKAGVKILPTGYFIEGKEVLKVRDTPSAAGKEVGLAAVGKTYEYLGETQGNWHRISLQTNAEVSPPEDSIPGSNGTILEEIEGWVSIDYTELVQ